MQCSVLIKQMVRHSRSIRYGAMRMAYELGCEDQKALAAL
jgi:hypothetical protein